MDLDKEFKYVLSLKEFINKSKNKLSKNEYTKLEYHLDEPVKKDILDEFDYDDSPGLTFNPNLDNTKVLNSFKESNLMAVPVDKQTIVQNRTIVDTSLVDHYKDLLNHSLDKFTELERIFIT